METTIRIRGYHTDLYKHVNNARYLEFLEEARWQIVEEYMEITDFLQNKLSFFVVNINISYRSPARVNDIIVIKTGLHKIGHKSAVFKQEIINKATGTICIQADITFVVADETGKAIALEGKIREAINNLPGI